MRTALCFYGKIGGSRGKNGKGGCDEILDVSFKHAEKNIININNKLDVFIHCWDVDYEEKVKALYRPIKCQFEDQISFDIPSHVKSVGDPHRNNNHYSRWYSTKQVLKMRRDFEKANNFRYDCVMALRFDLAWETPVIFDKFDMDYFYVSYLCRYWYLGKDKQRKMLKPEQYWHLRETIDFELKHEHMGYGGDTGTSRGLSDVFFFTKSEYVDKIQNVFDDLDEYTKSKHLRRLSSHQLLLHRLQETELIDKLRFAFHFLDECAVTRMWYKKFHQGKYFK
ncbi:hypothetical protein LCGC14_1329880 [marine sediment metagenome]|uniref:Uncharacterized protein n=1 Tax=marine sediment metagenome TaxID=412755 RepID=A0A0F9KGY2_9ZZZZ